MADDGQNVIWTPDGPANLNATRIELRPALMEWFIQFNEFARSQNIGIHCSLCKADLVAKNGTTDRRYSTTCGCREWVGSNRDWRPSAQMRVQ